MKTLQYVKTHNTDTLLAALITAVPALVQIVDGKRIAQYVFEHNGDNIILVVPDDTDQATVDNVIATHDAMVQSAAQQQSAQDTTSRNDLASNYNTAMSRLDQIQTQMASTPTNAQVVSAVNDLAIILKRTLKFVAIQAR